MLLRLREAHLRIKRHDRRQLLFCLLFETLEFSELFWSGVEHLSGLLRHIGLRVYLGLVHEHHLVLLLVRGLLVLERLEGSTCVETVSCFVRHFLQVLVLESH